MLDEEASPMKALNCSLTALAALALVLAAWAPTARAQDALRPLQSQQEKLARETGAAVVGLGHAQRTGRTPSEVLDGQAGGAGFVIDAEGDIVTCASRVPSRGEVTVTFRGGHRARAHFVASDPRTHIALLRLVDPATVAQQLGGKLPFLKLGRSSELKIGRLVGTIGNPYESVQTDGVPAFSLGVVSGLGRLRDADGYKGYVLETDAAVNPGSFGGPLVDVDGRAVGVVIEAYSPKRWFGAAVPIDEVAVVLDDLKAGRQPRPPRLGISVETAAEAQRDGIVVTAVVKDGPAARAGVRAGDRLRLLDGARIAQAFDLERELGELAQGSPVGLELVREQKALALTVVLDASTEEQLASALPQQQVPVATPTPGKGYAGLNVEEREGGVFVSQVVEGGPAAKAGIKVGDRIVAANDKTIKARGDLVDAIGSLSPGEKVALKIEREGWQRSAEIVLASKPAAATTTEPGEKGERPTRTRPQAQATKRGFLGVAVQPEEGEKGLKVSSVVPGSPAEKAKLNVGDTIVALDGKNVDSAEDFVAAMQGHKPGDKVELTVEREGWSRKMPIVLAERPADLDRPREAPEDEDHPAPKTREKSEVAHAWIGFALAEKDGRLVVDEVAPKSPADDAKLQKGDVVIEVAVADKKLQPTTGDQLADFLKAFKAGDKLDLKIERDGWQKHVSVTLGERPIDK
jgi:serine protease Do